MTFIDGLLLGIISVSTLFLIITNTRLLASQSEQTGILKGMYVMLSEIKQMSQATMFAAENFTDALRQMNETPAAQSLDNFSANRPLTNEELNQLRDQFKNGIDKFKSDFEEDDEDDEE